MVLKMTYPDINIYFFEAFRHKSSQIHDELNMAVVFGVLYQAVGGFPGPKWKNAWYSDDHSCKQLGTPDALIGFLIESSHLNVN